MITGSTLMIPFFKKFYFERKSSQKSQRKEKMFPCGEKEMSFALLLLLLECAAVTGQTRYFYVQVGDDVTLPCDQQTCDRPTWNFLGTSASGFLIIGGSFTKAASSRVDRLKLTETCSLDIQRVQVEDAGFYDCQNNGGHSENVRRFLSVVKMTKYQSGDMVTLRCSVAILGDSCPRSVKWLLAAGVMDEDSRLQISPLSCGVDLTFKTSHPLSDNLRFSKCEVTDDRDVNKQPITFSFQSTVEKPDEEPPLQTEPQPGAGADPGAEAGPGPGADLLYLYVAAAVLVVLLMVTVAMLIKWRRAKAKSTRVDDGLKLTSSATASPDPHNHTADPEDVSYASVTHIKKPAQNSRVDDDSVTYATVKSTSSPAVDSTENNALYATVTKAKR